MENVKDRAQVLLMAALTMAILFVALALILNTAIYTENLATRGSEIAGGGEAVRYLDTAEDGLEYLFEYVNAHHYDSDTDPHGALQRNLSAGVHNWSDTGGRQFSTRGRTTETSLVDTTNGTRIARDNADNFTNESGSIDWTVAENVNGTRNFRINITDASTLETFGSGHGFGVNVSDGSGDYWRMNVSKDSGDIIVGVRNGLGIEENYSTASEPMWVNVTDKTVDGDDYNALSLGEGVGDPYEIEFENADNITGTFTMVVDNRTLATSYSPHLYNDGSGHPYAAPAVYSANVTVGYQTPRLYYQATVRFAPGEIDD